MGFRIRKSFKIAPGVRFNLNKRGGSLSLGGKGATLNLSGRGLRSTIGIPGTGISYSRSSHKEYNKTYTSLATKESFSGFDIGWSVILAICLLLYLTMGAFTLLISLVIIIFYYNYRLEQQRILKNKIMEDVEKSIFQIELAEEMTAPYFMEINKKPSCASTFELREKVNVDLIYACDLISETFSYYSKINQLSEKYGKLNSVKIIAEKYWLGMSSDMLLDSLGEPSSKSLKQAKNGPIESWYYGNRRDADKFIIDQGVVTEIIIRQ